MILPDCTILIPTRDRANDLRETARLLCEHGLSGTPVIVIDDASNDPDETEEAVKALKNCRVIRQVRRTGQAGARNAGLRAAGTSYALLLDDDAHPDNPEALAAFLGEPREAKVAVWRFENIRERDGYRGGIPTGFPAVYVSGFIGFGVLMHRERVLSVGGFRECFMYRNEEGDLAIRLFRADLQILHVPGIRFIHRHNAVRSPAFEREYARLTARNTVLFFGMNYPVWFGLPQGLGRSLKLCLTTDRFRWAKTLGLLQGAGTLAREWRRRTPLTRTQMKAFAVLRKQETLLSAAGGVGAVQTEHGNGRA